MLRYVTLVLVLFGVCACQAQTQDRSAVAIQEILAADRAYSNMAKEKGTGIAFAAQMDARQGLLFDPGGAPILGQDAIFNARNDGVVPSPLTWTPEGAFASKAGDFGASWGYWSYKVGADNKAPTWLTGKYVTVWHRNEGGEWKGLMNIESADPPSSQPKTK